MRCAGPASDLAAAPGAAAISPAARAAIIYSIEPQTLTQGVIDSRIAESQSFRPSLAI